MSRFPQALRKLASAAVLGLVVLLFCFPGLAQSVKATTEGTPTNQQPPDEPPASVFPLGEPTPERDKDAALLPLPLPLPTPPPIGGGPWVAQGPGPSVNGQVENISPSDEVSGAIHTVAAHPSNNDILYAGATNGGIWKTTNATAASPTWTPLTDNEVSLSIGALEFDPTDGTHNTLVAGIGRYSAFAQLGGVRSGLLKTTDGGVTWAPMPAMASKNISGVAPRGPVIVATVDTANPFNCGAGGTIGVLRSVDGGANWGVVGTTAGFPTGVCFDLAGDRVSSNVLYTGVTFAWGCSFNTLTNGIYKSTDTGATWTKVSNAMMDSLIIDGTTNNIEIAADGLDVFVNIIQSGRPVGIFYSSNGGGTWAPMDLPRTPEGSPLAINIVWPGTPIFIDTGTPHGLTLNGTEVEVTGVAGTLGANGVWATTINSPTQLMLNGSSDPTAWIPSTGNWQKVVGLSPKEKPGGQGGIHASIRNDPLAPHVVYVGGDRQDSPFPNFLGAADFSGRLFRGDTLIAPAGTVPSPQWDHLTHSNAVGAIPNGGTFSSSAPHADSREMVFDAAGDIIEVDDGGIYRRTSPAGNTGEWYSINGDIQVTEIHDVAYDAVSRIVISGNQDTGTTQQQSTGSLVWDSVSTADGGDVAVDDTSVGGLSTRYSSYQNLAAFQRLGYDANNALISTIPVGLNILGAVSLMTSFVTPVKLNTNVPTRLVIGGCNAVFESFDQGDNLLDIPGLTDVNCNSGGLFPLPQNAIVYGGRSAGVPNDDVLYVGSRNFLYLRTMPGGSLAQLTQPSATSTNITAIALDPNEWRNVVAVDATDVYWTTDAGVTWTTITGNLTDPGFESAAYIPGSPDAVVVGGRDGVFKLDLPPVSPYSWGELGTGLPNAPVWDLEYDANAGTLTAGTMGRGAWVMFLRHLLSVTTAGSGSGTVTTSPPGISCGATCSALFAYDTDVTLMAAPAAGSTFMGFSGDADCADGMVDMVADVSCTATFEVALIFMDGFESGDTTAWSVSFP